MNKMNTNTLICEYNIIMNHFEAPNSKSYFTIAKNLSIFSDNRPFYLFCWFKSISHSKYVFEEIYQIGISDDLIFLILNSASIIDS